MKIGEKVAFKNLGECMILSEDNDTVFVSKEGVAYFITNPNKKRQEEEYSYDSVAMFGFTVAEIFDMAIPLYKELINSISKQYKIDSKLSQMVIKAISKQR
jgi:hypothetical protein